MNELNFRNISESDYVKVVSLVNEWWGGRNMSPMLPRLFFQHFQDTSFIVETEVENPEILGFLVGFVSQTNEVEAYIHFVGVHPEHRENGLGEQLYRRFFVRVNSLGCRRVSCVTSPVNKLSIAFHQQMGFTVLPGNSIAEDGLPITLDYDGPNEDRVLFTKEI